MIDVVLYLVWYILWSGNVLVLWIILKDRFSAKNVFDPFLIIAESAALSQKLHASAKKNVYMPSISVTANFTLMQITVQCVFIFFCHLEIRMSHWRQQMVDGAEHLISCYWLAFNNWFKMQRHLPSFGVNVTSEYSPLMKHSCMLR